MVKKTLCTILTAVMFISTLSGCAATKPSTAPKPSSTTTSKTTTLSFMDVSPSPARQAYFTKTFEEFKKESGISVAYQSVPWDDAANKMTVLGASGQLPDVMTTWAGWLGQYTTAGWVIPIDKYIKGTEDEYTDVVRDIVWKSENQLYGNTYTVPDGMMVKGVFVRKDWAKEKDITLDPKEGWTYDEYFDVVKKLTDVAKKRFGTSYRGSRGAFDPLLVYLESFNGGSLYAKDGSSLINSDESLDGFKKWTNLYLDGYAPKDSINWGFTEMVDNFTGGLTGTLINDSEVAATCEAKMKPEQWMVMPMPKSTKDGNIYNTLGSPYAYTISGNAKDPDSAWKLIEFLTRPENNIEYCKMGGLIPIKKAVSDDPTYGTNGVYSAFVEQLNNPDLVVPVSYGAFSYTDMHQGMLHEEVQKYLLGKEDAKTALGKISGELETRMKKYLADNEGTKVEEPKSLSK